MESLIGRVVHVVYINLGCTVSRRKQWLCESECEEEGKNGSTESSHIHVKEQSLL